MKLITDIPMNDTANYQTYVDNSMNDGTRNFTSRNSFDKFDYANCKTELADFVKTNHDSIIQLVDFMIENNNGHPAQAIN